MLFRFKVYDLFITFSVEKLISTLRNEKET